MAAGGKLPENLARFRKTRNMSQDELAHAAGVGVDTVARIEQGTRKTSRPATLNRLARALDVSVERLLGQVATAPPSEIDIRTLRQAITMGEHVHGLGDFAEPTTWPRSTN